MVRFVAGLFLTGSNHGLQTKLQTTASRLHFTSTIRPRLRPPQLRLACRRTHASTGLRRCACYSLHRPRPPSLRTPPPRPHACAHGTPWCGIGWRRSRWTPSSTSARVPCRPPMPSSSRLHLASTPPHLHILRLRRSAMAPPAPSVDAIAKMYSYAAALSPFRR